MATIKQNIERVISVLDQAVDNIETKGVEVPDEVTAEEQMEQILAIAGGGDYAKIIEVANEQEAIAQSENDTKNLYVWVL